MSRRSLGLGGASGWAHRAGGHVHAHDALPHTTQVLVLLSHMLVVEMNKVLITLERPRGRDIPGGGIINMR